MVRKSVVAFVVFILGLFAVQHASAQEQPALFITPTADNFEVYLSAAMTKKHVPVSVVTKEQSAMLVLKASAVDIRQQSAGSKVARCLFAYCAGIEEPRRDHRATREGRCGRVVLCRQQGRGEKNRQSLAEAIAKHLKADYFHK